MIFVMISTHKSQAFTRPSLDSLLKKTNFRSDDKIIIIDNDGSLQDLPPSTIIRNERPRSFAENANFAIGISNILKDDLILLNNDIIYTRNWLDFLLSGENSRESIVIPYCNQNVQYRVGSLDIRIAMDYEDYADQEEELEEIARIHRRELTGPDYDAGILMSFFCVYIPWKVSTAVGYFDERFGRGGGEDVDYRLRALRAGVEVLHSRQSYLLHFMGKSTWRSGEPIEETRSADSAYQRHFVEKWGRPVAEFFLSGSNKQEIANRYGLIPHLQRHDFRAILERLEDCALEERERATDESS
jgi:GT2 family glycosyltransferase